MPFGLWRADVAPDLKMDRFKILFLFVISTFNLIMAEVSNSALVPDLKNLAASKGERIVMSSPHKVLQHLDDSLTKSTKNVTQNPQMDVTLYQVAKDLVTAILSKLEIQDKITRITREALEAPGKNQGITAIETRRILDFISRTLSAHILSTTKASTEPELHRLVYGLAQIAAEVSIVSALKDSTYATALSKKQSVEVNLRKKRSPEDPTELSTPVPLSNATVFSLLFNQTMSPAGFQQPDRSRQILAAPLSPFYVAPRNERRSLHVLPKKQAVFSSPKAFLNQTALDIENNATNYNESDGSLIVLDKSLNGTEPQTLDVQEANAPGLIDDWSDSRDQTQVLSADAFGELEYDQGIEDDMKSEKRAKLKMERLEAKAKKAILYAGDVAYLTAASVIALRRALTASIEVQMSVRFAKTGLVSHQELMMNLAKTAAQQAGKEAKSAASKSLACERVIKLALKYGAQSFGAKLNHVANRVIMDSLSLATLAKSMAFVSSEIAINSLYLATDVRPPT